MALVQLKERLDGSPGLHALVIGIGDYPHGKAAGLPSITSPVVSAKAMAEWLIAERKSSKCELATLDVLLSGGTFEHKGVVSDGATVDEVIRAVYDLRGRARVGDHILLYVAGHGATDSASRSGVIFCSDTGQNEFQRYENSIRIDSILEGMFECPASAQLFMFDTCRVDGNPSTRFAKAPFENTAFTPLGQQIAIFPGPVNSKASGKVGEQSIFVKAFLASAKGEGCRLEGDSWTVRTSNLVVGMNSYLKKHHPGAPEVQPEGYCEEFCVHETEEPPHVNCNVMCAPRSTQANKQLEYHNISLDPTITFPVRLPPVTDANAWSLSLKAGIYTFKAINLVGEIVGQKMAYPIDPSTKTIHIEVSTE